MKELTKPEIVMQGRYLVTDQGIIIDKMTNMPVQYVVSNDYLHARLARGDTGKTHPFSVARIVALNFCENDDPDNKTQVDHVNGEKKYNWARNLEWVTPLENTRRAIQRGLNNHTGENNPSSQYSEEMVRHICSHYQNGLQPIDVFRLFYDGPANTKEKQNFYAFLWQLKKRKTWTKVSSEYDFSTETVKTRTKFKSLDNVQSFNEDDIRWICERLAKGDMKRQIAIDMMTGARGDSFKDFGYQKCYGLVSAIRRRTSWVHISNDYEFKYTNSKAQIEKHEYFTEFEELIASGVTNKHDIIAAVSKKYEKHPTYIGRQLQDYYLMKDGTRRAS